MIGTIPLEQILASLAMLVSLILALAFLVRPEPWSVMAILARRLERVGNNLFNVTFKR